MRGGNERQGSERHTASVTPSIETHEVGSAAVQRTPLLSSFRKRAAVPSLTFKTSERAPCPAAPA